MCKDSDKDLISKNAFLPLNRPGNFSFLCLRANWTANSDDDINRYQALTMFQALDYIPYMSELMSLQERGAVLQRKELRYRENK